MKYFIILKLYIFEELLRGHSHIEFSHSLRQNDANLQTHPPSTINIKCQICRRSIFISSGAKFM